MRGQGTHTHTYMYVLQHNHVKGVYISTIEMKKHPVGGGGGYIMIKQQPAISIYQYISL